MSSPTQEVSDLTAAIAAVIEKLSPSIIDQSLPTEDCGCGSTHEASEDVAVAIERPHADCSVRDWVAWSVVMRVPGTPETHITRRLKLSHWVSKRELRQLFAELFKQPGTEQ